MNTRLPCLRIPVGSRRLAPLAFLAVCLAACSLLPLAAVAAPATTDRGAPLTASLVAPRPSGDAPPPQGDWSWRRTTRGWEAVGAPRTRQLRPLPVHPLLLAAFQLLVSLYALLANADRLEMQLVRTQPDASRCEITSRRRLT